MKFPSPLYLYALMTPLFLGTAAHAQCARSDAVIDMSAHQVGAGIGYLWGHGTLSDGAHSYRFTVRGGGALSLGGVSLSGRGCVRNLARVQDFNGTYWTVGGTATMNHGTAGIVMENGKGTDIDFHARTHGAQLSGQVSRLSFRLLETQPPVP
ncbi:hypothetical protein NO263_02585 [Gluconacetobacter entanii]|uniref:DUF1134 domain-containing protein n=1 Tax=Gluconacetobacter entanii TaxID=108528 RepID=A0ABT3K242_9PROT|nr:hypothetical protein [Gluconacetobacter entanii]MCE2579451.1 hypothetical protein [Komagataeibacter sp. FNDCR1]MCW4589469.1 hypothetical protein [Gluconacetobacter entanii]MCW4593169.1 hypothetical protein [Gluconacetobacter entanii]